MDFSGLLPGQKIKYIGDSIAFGGQYTLVKIEETYHHKEACPDEDKGKLVIIELMNDDTPMFFTLDMLDSNEWELVDVKTSARTVQELIDTLNGIEDKSQTIHAWSKSGFYSTNLIVGNETSQTGQPLMVFPEHW